MVNSFAPHILGSQEGRQEQILDYENSLSGMKLIDGHRDWIEERMYPCLYYREDSFQVLESGDIWLSNTPEVAGSKSFDSAFPRLCTWAVMEGLNHRFLIVNCHLDHVQAHTRVEQIKVLIHEIAKINKSNLPLFLMGDFNDSPVSNVRKEIDKSDLDIYDPWLKLSLEERSSFHKFDGKDNSHEGGSRIDWILSPSHIECLDIRLELNSIDGIFPSDHFPVFAEFKL
ncbi:MAG: hypothetical protein GY909_13890 [Oligoflexia bacterium]|nr:hypothetical protein [Oligoflexia bacterium]